MDWHSKATKKHIKEAKSKKLTLIGSGETTQLRKYKFDSCGHIQDIYVSGVKNSNPRCRTCYISLIKREARALGLVWIKHIKGPSYLYECKKCKTKRKARPTELRTLKIIKCKTCHEQKLQNEAKKVGLKLIGEGSNSARRKYKIIKCSHISEFQIYDIQKHSIVCKVCWHKELRQDAKEVGLIFKGDGKSSVFKKYKCRKCKHEQDYRVEHIKSKHVRCQGCLKKKLASEAKSAGLEIVGEGRTKSIKNYRFKKCKHEQKIETSNVRRNNFVCNTCEETSRDLPSNVYLLRIEVGSTKWLKLGYAKIVRSRVLQYKLPEEANIERLKVLRFKKGRDAQAFESSIHKKYSSNKLSDEKMKKYHKSGFNECYPMKMLDALMEELDSATK